MALKDETCHVPGISHCAQFVTCSHVSYKACYTKVQSYSDFSNLVISPGQNNHYYRHMVRNTMQCDQYSINSFNAKFFLSFFLSCQESCAWFISWNALYYKYATQTMTDQQHWYFTKCYWWVYLTYQQACAKVFLMLYVKEKTRIYSFKFIVWAKFKILTCLTGNTNFINDSIFLTLFLYCS